MPTTPATQALQQYWLRFLNQLPQKQADKYKSMPEAWGFGDDGKMADELGSLVLAGKKTATCSLLWEYEADNENIPQTGELSIILDGQGIPICIIEITEVTIHSFNEVDDDFAYAEGEDDRTLAAWRRAHWVFFTRSCQGIGKEISESMPLVCERFQVIWQD